MKLSLYVHGEPRLGAGASAITAVLHYLCTKHPNPCRDRLEQEEWTWLPKAQDALLFNGQLKKQQSTHSHVPASSAQGAAGKTGPREDANLHSCTRSKVVKDKSSEQNTDRKRISINGFKPPVQAL